MVVHRLCHRLRHALDQAIVKRWLHQAPLSSPELAITCEEAISERHADPRHDGAFVVVVGVGHQDVLNVIRVAYEIDLDWSHREANDTRVQAGRTHQVAKRVAREKRYYSESGHSPRTWHTANRSLWCRDRNHASRPGQAAAAGRQSRSSRLERFSGQLGIRFDFWAYARAGAPGSEYPR